MESNDFKKKSWVFPFVQSKYSITSIPVRFPKLCPKHDTSFRKIFFLSMFQRSEEGNENGFESKLWNRTLRRLTLWKRSWIEPVDSTLSVECCSSFQERRGWFHRACFPSSGGKSRALREKRRQLLQRKVLPDIMSKPFVKTSPPQLASKAREQNTNTWRLHLDRGWWACLRIINSIGLLYYIWSDLRFVGTGGTGGPVKFSLTV